MANNEVAEAKYVYAQTWVCWDIEYCPVPRACKPERIAEQIRSALVKLNYLGPISISAYGNMDHIPPSTKKALSSTGILLNHVPPAEFELHIFDEILSWQSDNPAPANIMVISRGELLPGDREEEQSDDGYNILLAHPPHPPYYFIASAKTTWLWRSIIDA
ncbi:unnamed protein product [Microthlaspi erraticum]|uniref:NYN domain-containing protein n=1 Tax=Microthlaspi erraticum TaxID=1685480 RepID=A0A6D2HG48_9BRAS|nr:unnamed protein product [Microthlaspi erraticum]